MEKGKGWGRGEGGRVMVAKTGVHGDQRAKRYWRSGLPLLTQRPARGPVQLPRSHRGRCLVCRRSLYHRDVVCSALPLSTVGCPRPTLPRLMSLSLAESDEFSPPCRRDLCARYHHPCCRVYLRFMCLLRYLKLFHSTQRHWHGKGTVIRGYWGPSSQIRDRQFSCRARRVTAP